ncbi:MAG: hypothetical protein ABSF48_10110 [Thermodesulfobacteriota bacterium]|jgi:hypothetical protein
MATRKSMWALLSVFIIAAWLLGSVAQVMAETWKAKSFLRVTKMEGLPIPDAAEHWVGMVEREGVTIYENGELAWSKRVVILDMTKEGGPMSNYTMTTFQDGSTITTYTKGTPAGSTAKGYSAEIIHGTGRFQGIKGTETGTWKVLPPEKGEVMGKIVGECTMTFTLSPK